MSGHNEAYENYSAALTGANVLDAPSSGATLDLRGKSGVYVESSVSFVLPGTSPTLTTIYVLATGSITVSSTGVGGDNDTSYSLTANQLGTFVKTGQGWNCTISDTNEA